MKMILQVSVTERYFLVKLLVTAHVLQIWRILSNIMENGKRDMMK